MRILHVLDHSIPLHSGYTFRTRAILEQQRARGWETEHITSPKHSAPSDAVEEVDGFRFFRAPPSGGLPYKLPVVRQVAVIRDLKRRLQEVVEEIQPDILHAHSPALNGVAALDVGERCGVPVVYEVRAFWEDAAVDRGTSRAGGLRYHATRRLETRVLRGADAVTTICEGLRSDIVARGIPADKVTVIPNAVDISRFPRLGGRDPELAQEFGFNGCPVLGFIGSLYPYEGVALLVEALPAILAQAPNARFLLVGGGVEEDRVLRLAQETGVADRVHFSGRVPHDQVQRYYSLCDVMVYPRLSMRLTELVTPLKPLEAMALGRVVVASDVGGHRELIRPDEIGMLFRAGDRDDLARTVLEMLAARERWPEFHEAGRAFVEEERSWEGSVARYAPIYERLVEPARV